MKRQRNKHPKLFYTCHNLPQNLLDNKDLGDAVRILIKNNDLRLVALHNEMAQELNEMFGVDNTVVIRNGIDVDRFKNESISSLDMRKELHIPEDAYVIGHVGRFVNEKNHQFLLQLFKKVYGLNHKAYLLLVGSGPLESTILSRAEELNITSRFSILHHRSDIHRVLKAMDIFVFPSLREGLGIVVIEAQASGLKCIVSDRVPNDAIITNQVLKLDLTENLDVWANAVINPNLPSEVQGNLETYDMNCIIKQLEELYQ